jgi:hypothetical protein
MIKLKTLILSAGCILCWIVLFPLVVIGGGIALFLIAAGTELSHLITGTSGKGIDPSAAHDMAMRICFGYRARARAPSRFIR